MIVVTVWIVDGTSTTTAKRVQFTIFMIVVITVGIVTVTSTAMSVQFTILMIVVNAGVVKKMSTVMDVFDKSGSKEVDSLINECNNLKNDFFEWIPFERFTNVEYLAKGGFGYIYKATWLDGQIDRFKGWDHKENRFKRWGEHEVVLKLLHNSKQITSEFINEVK